MTGELSATTAGEHLLANFPVITLGIAALEFVRNLRKGMPPEEARELASGRLGVALSYAGVAWLVSAFSGIEATRLGVVATGEASRWIVRRMARELEPSILHVREPREVLTALATP